MSASLYMLDTMTASHLIRGKDPGLDKKVSQTGVGNICVSAMTEAELRFGCLQRPNKTELHALVDAFLSRVDRHAWDSDAASAYAVLRTQSQAKGVSLSNMDMLIGAHAVAVNATLVTDDGAFNHFKEWITTENWVNE